MDSKFGVKLKTFRFVLALERLSFAESVLLFLMAAHFYILTRRREENFGKFLRWLPNIIPK